MATAYIGTTSWNEIPGAREQHGEDGSVTITRFYNGAKTGFSAFRNNYPPGTSDPVWGSDARSVAYPTITKAGKATAVASITFRGGVYDGNGESVPSV